MLNIANKKLLENIIRNFYKILKGRNKRKKSTIIVSILQYYFAFYIKRERIK